MKIQFKIRCNLCHCFASRTKSLQGLKLFVILSPPASFFTTFNKTLFFQKILKLYFFRMISFKVVTYCFLYICLAHKINHTFFKNLPIVPPFTRKTGNHSKFHQYEKRLNNINKYRNSKMILIMFTWKLFCNLSLKNIKERK